MSSTGAELLLSIENCTELPAGANETEYMLTEAQIGRGVLVAVGVTEGRGVKVG